ncbi:hypothetical protein P3G55_10615 [Leptospira sp. 96542]|nr:hypothetical protein [Leptospira sp. 96542]
MFAPKSSVLVSILSGLGLVTVVTLTPVKEPESIDILLPETNDFIDSGYHPGALLKEENESKVESKKVSTERSFDLKSPIFIPLPKNDEFRGFGESGMNDLRSKFDSDFYVSALGERKFSYKSDKIHVRGVQSTEGSILVAKDPLGSPMGKTSSKRFESFELDYALTKNLSAHVTSFQTDTNDSRNRSSRGQTLAGISVQGGGFFDAKILAGDSTLGGTVRYYNSSLSQVRQIEANRRSFADAHQTYEWQANFTPSEYFKVQTSVFNIRGENLESQSRPEGGKVSLFMGTKKVQLNLRYNYVNSRPGSNGIFQSGFMPSQDIASFGMIVYLDSSRNYSIYLGNQVFNIFNDPFQHVKDNNGNSPATFSASLRGSNSRFNRSTFFLNFQNQFYKDGVLLGVPGGLAYSNLANGKSFYEYVTSMGMEIVF